MNVLQFFLCFALLFQVANTHAQNSWPNSKKQVLISQLNTLENYFTHLTRSQSDDALSNSIQSSRDMSSVGNFTPSIMDVSYKIVKTLDDNVKSLPKDNQDCKNNIRKFNENLLLPLYERIENHRFIGKNYFDNVLLHCAAAVKTYLLYLEPICHS